MFWIGQMIGGAIAIAVLTAILEKVAMRRLTDDPRKSGCVAVVCAYALAVVLYGFGGANGGPFNTQGVINYLPGAAGLLLYFFLTRDPAPVDWS